MKAIEEVTYYCKDCKLPFADETVIIFNEKVKTGRLICLECGRIKEANVRYV